MTPPPEPDVKFEALLDFLRQTRGFDFTGYKRPSLMRRVSKRMEMLGVKSYEDYMDYLEVHQDEFAQLFNSILINVTSFFRDPQAWGYFSQEALPRLLESKKPDEPIRAWSAGCATGEEAYTLAIVLAEALGIEAFRHRVKIYATDVDEDALAIARQATYRAKDLDALPADLRGKYFEPLNSGFIFRSDMRRSVIFGRHDLIQDAPISRLDILVCRNTLMYFNAETQVGILARFHFALNQTALLFLGKAELLLTHAKLFTPVEMRYRVFSKADNANIRERLPSFTLASQETANHVSRLRLRDAAFDASPGAHILINANGHLLNATQQARSLLGLLPRDLGRPFLDLEICYRPAELRPLIDQAYAERRTVALGGIERRLPDGQLQYLEVQITPLYEENGGQLGVAVSYTDVTSTLKLQEELEHANQELETTSEELQSTNEELETTNEELQSTNEELETTNEELQSTNEELETMNEELQSTNEELHTVNEELRNRTEELNHANAFLSSILASMRSAMVVLDSDMIVLMWNPRADDLWGVREEEAKGKPFMNLDIGLPVEELRRPIRVCLTGESEQQETLVDAVNRRGRKIRCRITFSRFVLQNSRDPGVIMLMEEAGE